MPSSQYWRRLASWWRKEGGDWVGPTGTAWVSEASSRCAGVSSASPGSSRSKHGSGPLLPPVLVVARCRKGTPSRLASAGATTLPPAP